MSLNKLLKFFDHRYCAVTVSENVKCSLKKLGVKQAQCDVTVSSYCTLRGLKTCKVFDGGASRGESTSRTFWCFTLVGFRALQAL